jgi:hypothetical protein
MVRFGMALALCQPEQWEGTKTQIEGEPAMTIQKKSLIKKLNTTKQATVASSAAENPSVSAPVSARRLVARKNYKALRMKALKKPSSF